MKDSCDVLVIGGGHAGCEAAAAAARMGARTVLLTQRRATLGEMSCNPSIGGIGKGHLVREIDALDGLMGRAADAAGIHFKLLNRSKGPAVRGPRVQVDRARYREVIQEMLAAQPSLSVREGSAEGLELAADGSLRAIVLADGATLGCGAAVLATGTFLRGRMHVGAESLAAGRVGEAPSIGLADALQRLGLPLGRLKTGTPPRLARSSIDWSGLAEDPSDTIPEGFSLLSATLPMGTISCHVTATTPDTHALIRANLHLSAVYGGHLSGRGPRYCPSVEDKVVRFPDRGRHQVFLEPEGLDDPIIYPNGISTSLPEKVQAALIATIPGLERAHIVRPGYAIAYDYVDPRALWPSLELRAVPRLFLAGQINGTTGYEEAGAQGLIAGINAARRSMGGDVVTLDRADAYIGVMIDDLISRGVTEPYRMFTSRAEYRLSLRTDNADLRLTRRGIEWGCVGQARQATFTDFECEVERVRAWARTTPLQPSEWRALGIEMGRDRSRTVFDVLGTDIALERLLTAYPTMTGISSRVLAALRADAQYAGYLVRQDKEIRSFRRAEGITLDAEDDYRGVPGLSDEARARLIASRPVSLGAAARMEGMTPAALAALSGHVRRRALAGRFT